MFANTSVKINMATGNLLYIEDGKKKETKVSNILIIDQLFTNDNDWCSISHDDRLLKKQVLQWSTN